jgi:nicotinate phosphoribosyltransferase
MRESGLLVDLYELTMAQSYVAEGMDERPATFSLFARKLPPGWGYLVAAGLDDALSYLEQLRFDEADLEYLEGTGIFAARFLERLAEFRFRGSVRALPEGTLCFPGEPLLEIQGTLLEAQLVETMVLNELYFQSLVAAKAARAVDAARGRTLVDFGLRRTPRAAAGMRVARSSYLAGFDATSNVLAGREYGIPVSGTMAHSYVEAFDHELDAFRAFARSFPDRSILLVDTYDSVEGVRRAALVGRELAERGHALQGIRLDSGDLDVLARQARAILDEAGLAGTTVFASGGLDERAISELLDAGAPIDGFGVGGRLGTPGDAPSLDMAYKLVEVDGRPTLKLSAGKETLPGPKQVWRISDENGLFVRDVVGVATEEVPAGEALLEPVMVEGRRVAETSLESARERCLEQRRRLPERHRRLDAEPYEVRLSDRLAALSRRAVAETRERELGLAGQPVGEP